MVLGIQHLSGDWLLGVVWRGGLQQCAAPFWQAAPSKARFPASAYPPPLCMSLWLTPSFHHLPQSHGECWVGDKGHGGIAGTGTAWQTLIYAGLPGPTHSGCRGTGWRSCLSPNPFFAFVFFFLLFLPSPEGPRCLYFGWAPLAGSPRRHQERRV